MNARTETQHTKEPLALLKELIGKPLDLDDDGHDVTMAELWPDWDNRARAAIKANTGLPDPATALEACRVALAGAEAMLALACKSENHQQDWPSANEVALRDCQRALAQLQPKP